MAITAKLPDAVITESAGVGGMVAPVARTVCVQGGKLKREWQDNTQQLQNRNRCSPSGLGLVFDMKWSSVTAPNPQRNMSVRVYLFTLTQRQWLAGLLFICIWNGTSIKNMQKEKKKRSDHSCCSWVVTSELHQLYILGPQVTTFICDGGDGLYPPPCTSVWMSPAVLASVSHQFDSQCDHNLPNDHYRRWESSD